jgi:hypothetical protein
MIIGRHAITPYAALLPMFVTVLVGYIGSACGRWGCR